MGLFRNGLYVMSSLPAKPAARRVRRDVLTRLLQRKALGRNDIAPLPRGEVMYPAQLLTCQPGLFEIEHLNRVRASAFDSSLYDEVAKLTTTQFIDAPLERYRLGPCIIAGGSIFTQTATHILGPVPAREAIRGPMEHLDKADVVSSEQGLKYYGHWMRDDCTLYELLRQDGPEPWALARPDWPDAAFYETAFDQSWPTLNFTYVQDLTVYREQRFNLDKARRFNMLRAKLRARYPDHQGGHIVYLSRGTTGSPRNMSNGAAFEAAMRAAGIKVVNPESGSEAGLLDLLNARMIITIEGSQASHGAYMLAEGGAMLILQSPDRFYNPHHEWARLIGMGYGTVVGTPDDISFHISPDEVMHMVQRLENAPRKAAH